MGDDVLMYETTVDEGGVVIGKGIGGCLKLLRSRGSLKETVEWSGRNMDKKKTNLVGIDDAALSTCPHKNFSKIRIERRDEYGRVLTPKEAFRRLSHKFYGKGPGKRKQEKRMRRYMKELETKKMMRNGDTPLLSAERMREAQAKLQSPYLVLF